MKSLYKVSVLKYTTTKATNQISLAEEIEIVNATGKEKALDAVKKYYGEIFKENDKYAFEFKGWSVFPFTPLETD